VWEYANEQQALADALRLSRGMTYKAAVADVPFGGGKAVVLLDASRRKTPEMMYALGLAIERLGGSYVTGEDVGTTAADMLEIRRTTDKVMGMPRDAGGSGDPSPNTARGCLAGMRASVRYLFGTDSLQGWRVAVQGVGNVGYHLCGLLHAAGAKLVVSDVDARRAQRCAQQFGAQVIAPEQIYDEAAGVFAPCAMGAILTPDTIARLRVKIVAGAANNQLQRPECGELLRHRGILYAPDYVINAGGMIQLASERLAPGALDVTARIEAIGTTLYDLYRQADARGLTTLVAADRLAEGRFARKHQQCAGHWD
jgi:leucine dehydrogenase